MLAKCRSKDWILSVEASSHIEASTLPAAEIFNASLHGIENQEKLCREEIRMSSRQPGGFWIQVDQVENANQVSQVVNVNQVVQADEVKQAKPGGLWDAARRGLLHQV